MSMNVTNTLIQHVADSRTNSFTSTGIKLLAHSDAIDHFLKRDGKHIIGAQVAPTNSCNLHCHYCNQDERIRKKSLPLETITNWLSMLLERGLKSVIITGGGEPTLYPQFNKLLEWLDSKNLSRALITNGTNSKNLNGDVNFDGFDWIRVSLNRNKGGELYKVALPKERKGNGILGFSMVYTGQNEDAFKEAAEIANEYNARYLRVLPDACQDTEKIIEDRKKIREIVAKLGLEKSIFVQEKNPEQALFPVCYQSYFRPFLLPDGRVAPCDCFMMNKDANGNFYKTLPSAFNLESEEGNPLSYADFLDGKWTPKYSPETACNNCSFNTNNSILNTFVEQFAEKRNNAQQTMQEQGWQVPENVIHKDYI